ncbi:hypothetical protein [Rubrivirga sp.]|uniref:hypothetical protein n=1 Tax=Rubrivirga sp. TaxID=1885344 RepID=UPI003B52BED1
MVHFLDTIESEGQSKSVYILMDEHKRLKYPDVLIRLVIDILDGLPVPFRRTRRFFRAPARPDKQISKLRSLLDSADESDVVQKDSRESSDSLKGSASRFGATGEAHTSSRHATDRTASFREKKLDYLERHIRDFKDSILKYQSDHHHHSYLAIDDFYLANPDVQPDIIDYIHRLVRDSSMYLKLATVRHRTRLSRNYPQTVGLELSQDAESIDLDRTFEDFDSTRKFLSEMLDSLGRQVGINNVSEEAFNPEAFEALTLASGGVPRDFLTTFSFAVESALASSNKRWLTPTSVYKGASRLAWQTKLSLMREDVSGDADGLERLLTDLLDFCLNDHKKTAFLVSQNEAQSNAEIFERIQQLMDFKLIHVVEPDTSAASGRQGRYAAYTLDFSFFMEPRRRGIDIVEFWKIDDQRRRKGIREAPVYPLIRAQQVFEDTSSPTDPKEVLAASDTSQLGP